MFFLGYGCTLRHNVFLTVCQVLCANVVCETSSEGFLVTYMKVSTSVQPIHSRSTVSTLLYNYILLYLYKIQLRSYNKSKALTENEALYLISTVAEILKLRR